MSNLKTDDILGARPRIRHAPRNLIREQKQAQQPNDYSTAYYGYAGPQANHYQYPYSQNVMPKASFVGQVGMSESYMEPTPGIAGKSSDKIHSVNRTVDRYENIKRKTPFILPKDAPIVNYDTYHDNGNRNKQMTSYTRAFDNGPDKQIYERYRNNLNMSREMTAQNVPSPRTQREQASQNIQKRILQKPRSMSSVETSSRTSNDTQKYNVETEPPMREEKSKNIFRGLGYNIITNSKFAYDMENRLKNSTSKWLQ